MAIRMKEWGMLSAPSPAVRVPVQGVLGWSEVAGDIGSGISSVISGGAALAQQKDEVNAAGDLAEFSGRLHAISEETREELAERDVKDWEYSWQELSAPRFAEAVAELPPAAREAGRELAEAFSRKAAVQALRDHELNRLDKSRTSWQRRVESAVRRGDAAQAESWLQSAAGVFVPQGELEQARRRVRSRACVSGWRRALAENPLRALGDIRQAPEDALPRDAEDKRYFEAEVRRYRRDETARLAETLARYVTEQEPFDDELMQQAGRAGLLDERQLATADAPQRVLSPAERCDWMRRVDEVADSSEARTRMKLNIATAPFHFDERRELLERLQTSSKLSSDDRLTLSRSLWQMYERGEFGCPGDAAALQRLADLQKAGLPVLVEEGSEAAARWLEHVRGGGERWVCFSQNNK